MSVAPTSVVVGVVEYFGALFLSPLAAAAHGYFTSGAFGFMMISTFEGKRVRRREHRERTRRAVAGAGKDGQRVSAAVNLVMDE